MNHPGSGKLGENAVPQNTAEHVSEENEGHGKKFTKTESRISSGSF